MELLNKVHDFTVKCWNRLSLSIVELVFGVLVLISAEGAAKWLFVAAGILLVLVGVGHIVVYDKNDVEQIKESHHLFRALFCIALGVFAIVSPGSIVKIFPGTESLYGVLFSLIALLKIEMVFNDLRKKENRWYLAVASCVLSLLTVIFLFFVRMGGIWVLTAILLFLTTVVDFISHLVLIGKIDLPQTLSLLMARKSSGTSEDSVEVDMRSDTVKSMEKEGKAPVKAVTESDEPEEEEAPLSSDPEEEEDSFNAPNVPELKLQVEKPVDVAHPQLQIPPEEEQEE